MQETKHKLVSVKSEAIQGTTYIMLGSTENEPQIIVNSDGITIEEAYELADMVVKAVNSHHSLVEALHSIHLNIRAKLATNTQMHFKDLMEIKETIEEALKEAGE